MWDYNAKKHHNIQARKIGVKIDELLVCQPDSGEQALEIADTLVQGTIAYDCC